MTTSARDAVDSWAPPAWYSQPAARRWSCAPGSAAATRFHESFPAYRPTPLVEAPTLAAELDVGRLFVKDESARLGLPAFKMLGASWATCRALAARSDADGAPATLDGLCSLVRGLGRITLYTATDGNHGRAVARMAAVLGLEARILVPEGLDTASLDAIRGEGAQVVSVPASYDETVRQAAALAGEDPDAVLIQDTAWPGYEQIPQWIVDGYATMFREADDQLAAAGARPTGLLAVPVGVGSLAQAAVVHHRSGAGGRAALLAVEPDTAACVTTSLTEGRPRTVETGRTAMAGLNCGTPSSIAWPYLAGGLDAAVTVDDARTQQAVDTLDSIGLSSGPSGAASLSGVRAALCGPGSARRRAELAVDADTTVVLLSTEGR